MNRTSKLPEQRSHILARAHVELGVSENLARQVIFQGADPTVSPNRRRIYEWALARGYLKAAPKVSDLLDRANEALEGGR